MQQLKMFDLLPLEAEMTYFKGLVQVLKANIQAGNSYLSQEAYPNKITLFRASELHPGDAAFGGLSDEIQKDPTFGWRQLSMEAVEVHSVPGDHVTMMVEPHVQILAERLGVCLEHTQIRCHG